MSAITTATVLAGASLGLAAVGTGVQVLSTLNRGQAQAADYSYQSQVAANNAMIAQQNADRATAAGQAKATAESLKAAQKQAKIKVGQAASGVDVNSGSAVDVQASERELGHLDAETVLNNAQVEAYGYRSQASNYDAQSHLYAQGGKNAQSAALLDAGGGLLSNASALGFRWSGLTKGDASPSPGSGGTGPSGYSGTTAYSGGDYGSSV